MTPEAIQLTLDVAGLGSRMIAILIDSTIQVALFVVLGYSFASLGLEGTTALAALFGSFFFVFWGYFFLFEVLWNGRTPGKRAQRIRVVGVDGQPVGWVPSAVRNLIRIIDLLPTAYAIGSLSILLTKRSQRLGDLAAGTVVIRERPAPTPMPLLLPPEATIAARNLDTTALTEAEYSLLRSFLDRRNGLVHQSRQALAAQLAAMIRPKVGGADDWRGGDEPFLDAAAASYRARFQSVGPALPPPPPPA